MTALPDNQPAPDNPAPENPTPENPTPENPTPENPAPETPAIPPADPRPDPAPIPAPISAGTGSRADLAALPPARIIARHDSEAINRSLAALACGEAYLR